MGLIYGYGDLMRAAGTLEFGMPGWRVEWRHGSEPGDHWRSPEVLLALHCRTQDTYRPSDRTPIDIVHLSPVPLPMPVDALPGWFRRRVHAALTHEADEWIRVDGWMQFNPHGEPKQVGFFRPAPTVADFTRMVGLHDNRTGSPWM